MLEIRGYATPNSVKVVIAAEELDLPYKLVPVDLRRGEQRSDAFKSLNPNGKVPVLIDHSPAAGGDVVLSESAAIMVYLAEKENRLLPTEPVGRSKVFEQLFFHASGLSPAFLQAFLIGMQKEPIAEAKEAALKEVDRVLAVLDGKLGLQPYAAGDEYTIADIAHFGWIWRHTMIGAQLDKFEFVRIWHDQIISRPAVVRAIANTMALAE